MPPPLPIYDMADDLAAASRTAKRLVLSAPTGSGKSTQVPQILLDHNASGGRILVLQPRRLAARILAQRVARERNGRLGEEIGFQTRFEKAVSNDSRIVFMTDGILPRLLQRDHRLQGIGTIIFDEFHERSLSADMGLALSCQTQQQYRPDLKLIVMSATLDVELARSYLGECVTLHTEGRAHPVDVRHLQRSPRGDVWDLASGALGELLREGAEGDVLVFMPGAYEIRRTVEACTRLRATEKLRLLPLYGALPPDRQDDVMAPCEDRKVIVATNIAETSLTIPGIRHVIDAGLARTNRYDPSRGFNTLQLETISRESADQRAGRAGRETPGTCRRLWTLAEQQRRPAHTAPEIARVDLSETVLFLRALGVDDVRHFPWISPPSPERLDAADDLLRTLGLLDPGSGAVTLLGHGVSRLPAHPRLGVILKAAGDHGCGREAALIAAILNERPLPLTGKAGQQLRKATPNVPPVRGPLPDPMPSDFFALISALHQAQRANFAADLCNRLGISGTAARQVWRTAALYERMIPGKAATTETDADSDELIKSLLRAFPDRIARRRDAGSLLCEVAGGKRYELARWSTIRDHTLLVAAEIHEIAGGGRQAKSTLSHVSAIREEWLYELFADDIIEQDEVVWDEKARQVIRRSSLSCRGLILEETVSPNVDPAQAAALLAQRIASGDLKLKGWNKDVELWMERTRWVAEQFPEKGLISYDDTDLEVIYQEICQGARRYKEIKDKPCLDMVKHALSWEEQQFIEKMAPPWVKLPCGIRMKLRYALGQPPKGRARIQDLYDLPETPRVAGNRVPVLLEILAPNMRAVQITDDLQGFWERTYPKARSELARRYPKHEWR